MSSKTTPNAQLFAFLAWNAILHLKTALSDSAYIVSMRWRATREGYEMRLFVIRSQFKNAFETLATGIFELIIVIFIVGALIGNIANATTGITIAHTGFTPNPNLTASPGAVPLTQLFPLIFISVGILGAFEYFKHRAA